MDFAFIVPACPPERSRLLLKQIDLETKQCKLKSNADPLYARAQDRDAHGLAPPKIGGHLWHGKIPIGNVAMRRNLERKRALAR